MNRMSALFFTAALLTAVLVGSGEAQGWIQTVTTGPTPSARGAHGFVYDSGRQQVLLFGGTDFGSSYRNDMWVLSGSTWTQLLPAAKPSARYLACMAYDSTRGFTILFGGRTSSRMNDTWEWNGLTWTQLNPITVPTAVDGAAMVYDVARQKMVMFGGSTAAGVSNQTWEYNAATNNWTLLKLTSSPPARSNHEMAYDAARNVTVLFGGSNGKIALNDTWEFNGTTWTQANFSTPLPLPRHSHGMAYDPRIGHVVLFGGTVPNLTTYFNDTWVRKGNGPWIQLSSLTPKPGTLAYAPLVHDGSKILFFGGGNQKGALNTTWELSLVASIRLFSGTPQIGNTITLELAAPTTDAGLAFQVGSSFGNGPIAIGTRSLGLSPDPLLWISVSGAVAPSIFQNYSGMLDAQGKSSNVTIHIPNDPALKGIWIYNAFVSLSPAAPEGVSLVSDTYSFLL